MDFYEEDMEDLRFRIIFLEEKIIKINDKLSEANRNTVLSLMATVMRLSDLREKVEDLEEQVFTPDLKNRRFRKRKPNLIRGKIRTKNLKLKNITN
jgi:hypothetical protein